MAVSQARAKATRSSRKATGPARKATRSVKKATRPAARKAARSVKKTTRAAKRPSSAHRNGAGTTRKTGPSARRNGPARRDAIALLKADHRTVEKLFKSFEKAGDGAHRTKRRLVDDIIRELSVHAAIEEQFLYPAVRRELPHAEGDALEAIEEHHVVKWILSELDRMSPEDERFDAKVTVLIENVRHHVREEERELFQEMRAGMSRKSLVELGEKLAEAKVLAPTRPHPRSPDEPPGNLIVGTVAGVVDRARTAVTGR